MFRVDSEVGRLRQVILHRPDLELKRLTPDNAADLLFDDVLWVSRAQAGARRVRRRAAVPRRGGPLLQRPARPDPGHHRGPRLHPGRGLRPRWHGPLAAASCARRWTGWTRRRWRGYLVGGITKREIAELAPEPKSIAFHSLDPDGFVLAPLPNLLYQRDTSCWIYGGVSINAMRRQARVREYRLAEAIYRWHPMFAGAGFDVWYHGADAAPATIEGGDVLVIGNGAVLAGMSERTTPQALEMLAHRLFAAGAATSLVAIDMPKQRAFMHLDTMLTMADYGVFTKYAGMGMLRVLHDRAGRERARTEGHRPPARGHAHGAGRRARPAEHQGADRRPGRPLGAAGAVGRRVQRAGGGAGRGRRLRAERDHQRLPGGERHRGDHRRGRRTGPWPGWSRAA